MSFRFKRVEWKFCRLKKERERGEKREKKGEMLRCIDVKKISSRKHVEKWRINGWEIASDAEQLALSKCTSDTDSCYIDGDNGIQTMLLASKANQTVWNLFCRRGAAFAICISRHPLDNLIQKKKILAHEANKISRGASCCKYLREIYSRISLSDKEIFENESSEWFILAFET